MCSDKFLSSQQMACGTVLGITLMKQLNVRRCKRLRVAKGPVNVGEKFGDETLMLLTLISMTILRCWWQNQLTPKKMN